MIDKMALVTGASSPQTATSCRFIQPQEVAGLVHFLLSPAATAMTGQQLVLCGGASLS